MNNRSIEDIMRERSIPPDLEWDPENPMQVNSCSGNDQIHTDSCDGNCEKKVVDEWDIKIENERRAWARIGIDHNAYRTNMLRLDIQVQTLIKVVTNKLGVSDDEFNETFKPLMHAHMQTVREQFQEQMKANRIKSSLLLPDNPGNLL